MVEHIVAREKVDKNTSLLSSSKPCQSLVETSPAPVIPLGQTSPSTGFEHHLIAAVAVVVAPPPLAATLPTTAETQPGIPISQTQESTATPSTMAASCTAFHTMTGF